MEIPMALNYGISYGLLDEETPETKAIGVRRFNRLSEDEKQFYHADPFMQVGLMQLMLTTDIRTIVPSSAVVLYNRYHKVDPETLILLINWVCNKCIRDIDPDDIRELSKAYVATPYDRKLFRGSTHEKLFVHWLSDRFGGTSTNISTMTCGEWQKRLRNIHSDQPVVTPLTRKLWSKERTALFESWAKEPIIA